MKKAMTAYDLSDATTRQSGPLRERRNTGRIGYAAATSLGRRISPLIVCAVFALVGCSDKPDSAGAHVADSVSDANAAALAAASDARESAASAASDASAAKAAASDVETAAAHVETVAADTAADVNAAATSSKDAAVAAKAAAAGAESRAAGATADVKAGTVSASSDPVAGKSIVEGGAALLDHAGKGVVSLAEGGGALLGRISGRLRDEEVRGATRTSDAQPAGAAQTVAIPFGFDATTFSPAHARLLDAIVAALLQDPACHAILTGHADRHGAVAYNRTLARARAESVRDHLLGRGVGAAQLTVHSDAVEGKSVTIADGTARRVDVTLRASGERR